METKQLLPITLMLVLVGMLVGVGIFTLDSLSTASKTNTDITNETVTITSAAGTLGNTYVQSVSFIGNTTFRCDLPNTNCFNITNSATGAIRVNGSFKDGPFNVSYVYKKSTAASTAIDNTVGALDDIPGTWMALIVTVVVLSIILALVIGSFSGGVRK